MISGQLSHEIEMKVPASKVWELYRGLQLGKLVQDRLSNLVPKVEVVEGDGEEGTILNIIFAPGLGVSSYKEKFIKLDDEKLIKEAEVVEGGYLDIGFTLYRIRFQIIQKSEEDSSCTCILQTTIEYQLKDEAVEKTALVSLRPFTDINQVAHSYLVENQPN